MEKLIRTLKKKIAIMEQKTNHQYDLSDDILDQLYYVYPFNKFEYIISHLIATKTITLRQYLNIRNNYLQRNKFLYLFEITAPRSFGETWAQNHLNALIPELQRPNTHLDPDYSGEYDFWYDHIKIEVKASRAVKRKSGDQLVLKALLSDSKYGFDMNFQQIKPTCCDVFVWIGVWRDLIKYWVLSSDEVKNNQYFSSKQHRGNKGEGQLWITETNITEFEQYAVSVHDLFKQILAKVSTTK